jgi:hypothetical protein
MHPDRKPGSRKNQQEAVQTVAEELIDPPQRDFRWQDRPGLYYWHRAADLAQVDFARVDFGSCYKQPTRPPGSRQQKAKNVYARDHPR